MSDEPLTAFRPVPRTGVIFVTTEARFFKSTFRLVEGLSTALSTPL